MNSKRLINLFGYIAVILIAISLIAKYLVGTVFHLDSNIANICSSVAYYLGLLITVLCAFSYASTKRNGIYMILLVIFVIAIIVFNFIL